jgi:uncharacterized protein YkwD
MPSRPDLPDPRRRLLVIAAAAALPGLAACTIFGSAYQVVRVSEREATDAINALRARNGVGPVRVSNVLQVLAAQQARWMAEADELSHEVRTPLAGRIERAGYQGVAGENISAGHSSLRSALDGWMASPGHRRNMLDPRFTEYGIAAARVADGRPSRFGIYWAIVLGAPRADIRAA